MGASLRPNNANNNVSRTGSIGEKTNKAQKDKAVSAKLSEKQPRNQQIAAVGIAAPIPTVISELDAAALRQLTKSAEASLR
jgi:hypothetical protein